MWEERQILHVSAGKMHSEGWTLLRTKPFHAFFKLVWYFDECLSLQSFHNMLPLEVRWKTTAPKRLTNEGVGDVAPPLHHLPRVWNFTGRRWNEGTKTSTYYSSSKINHKGDLCQEASTDRNSVSEPLVVNQSGLIFTHGVQFSKSTACENTCIMSLWLWREHHKALKITRRTTRGFDSLL